MAAQRAESSAGRITSEQKKQRSYRYSPGTHERTRPGLPNHQHRRSKPRSYERTSSYRSLQMPRLSRSFMHYRLSGRNQHPEIHLGISNEENFSKPQKTLKETSALPAVCGRVCPQEKQCESKCFYTQKLHKEAVAIGYLERFAADYERESGQMSIPEITSRNGIKIAVVGSGPAGLSFAGDMIKKGYSVTVFEALHEIGGVLKYGIPEFRLPNKIVDVEIDNLRKMGVEFMADCIIGKTLTYEDLHEMGFKGIFVASGAGLPRFMNIPGENLIGVMSSNEYLTRVDLMDAASSDSDTPVIKGKRVAIIGGGNTAMDSVRTARRLGADRAMIVYRRSEEEMPARIEEIKHAKQEGVEFLTLHNPIEYIGDQTGHVKQMRLQKMELGEPDASGRRSPVPIPGATDLIDIDEVVVSVRGIS